MTSYDQLSLKERELLFGALKQGKSLRNIGKVLGRSHTTLARELKRNCKYVGGLIFPVRLKQDMRISLKSKGIRHH